MSALLLLMVGIPGLVWVERYQPLGPGSSGFRPELSVDPRPRDVSAGEGPVQTLWIVRPTEGVPFTYAFSIRNDGPIAVTVTSIGTTPEEQRGDVVVRLPRWVDPDPYDNENVHEPFHSFTLAPGDEANVWMEATMARCPSRDSTLTWYSEPIGFKVWGLHRTTDFLMPIAIRVSGGDGRCVRV